MSDESDDNNLGIKNKIAQRVFTKFLGATGAAVTLPSLVPLWSPYCGNSTSISSDSNTKTLVDNYQANLIVLK